MLRTQRRQDAVDTIAGWIVGGRFRPGDTLPIESAWRRARGEPHRRARSAQDAEREGNGGHGPRVGTRVLPMSDWNLFDPDVLDWRLEAGVDAAFVRDLMELRLTIEPAAARLAARRRAHGEHRSGRRRVSRMVDGVAGRGHYLAADMRSTRR